MTENRRDDAERVLARDMQALRSLTARDLPTLQDTARTVGARSATRPRQLEEGFWMKSMRGLNAHRWIAIAAATVAVAAILGLVPVSYERTTGHDVTLSLATAGLDAQAVQAIAGEFKTTVGAPNVNFMTSLGTTATAEISARVPASVHGDVERNATAFARALGAKGITAAARVVPVREKVSTNMVAMALNRAIELHVDTTGKNAQQIEADIRSQLEAAGVQNPQVQVTKDGNQTQVQIHADQHDADQSDREFKLDIQHEGSGPLDANMHKFEVHRRPGETDAEVKAEIEAQMRAAGVSGTVNVDNGKIEVKVEKKQ